MKHQIIRPSIYIFLVLIPIFVKLQKKLKPENNEVEREKTPKAHILLN